MKSITTTMKKAALLPVLCLSLLCFGQSKQTGNGNENENGKIEFVKSENGQLFFEVALQNIPVNGCLLTISNQESNVIFEDRIAGDHYRKTFRIQNDGHSKIYFEVNGKKYRVTQEFNLSYKVETKWEVTKL